MHVVVFEEGDMTTEFVIVAETQYFVNEVAPRFVGRVRFACKHDLDGPPPIVEQLLESVEISEQECCTFVGGEPPGESDREGFRIQQRSSGDRLHRLEMAANPAVPGTFTDKPHQFASCCLSNGPEGVIRQVRDPLPDGGVIDPFCPIGAEVFGIERVRFRGDPGGRVDAVGEAADRNEILCQARPQVLPHLSRDAPVLAAYAVDVGRQPHRKGGHIEAVSGAFRRFAQAQELFSGKSELAPIITEVAIHQVKRKNIVPGRNGGVRGEHGALPNQVTRLSVAVSGGDEFPDAFYGQESRMAFIAMPDCGTDTQGA